MNNDTPESLEVVPPSAIHAMEAASVDMQIKTARMYPRSLELFKKRALQMACIDEDTAESCIYVRPVGKEKNEKGQWVEKMAEGASVRLAEIVSVSYGNIRISAAIVEQTERYVKCVGTCHDLESNSAGRAEVVESTVNREGQPYSERQRALIAKVCVSKAYRDAIFRVVPRALCKPIIEAAKRVIAKTDKPIAERIKRVQAWLSSIKVDDARVFALLNVNGWSEITGDHLTTLTGLKTALSEGGDLTIDEAFPHVAKKPVQEPGPGTQPKNVVPMPGATTAPATAPTSAPEPKAANGAQTAPKAPESQPEKASDEQTAPTDKPTCKYCGKEVDDMSAHNCEQMQQAIAKEQQKAAAGDPQAEYRLALENLEYVAKQHSLTLHQVLLWLRANKVAKENQKLADLAAGKLKNAAKQMEKEDIRAEIGKFAKE